MQTQLKKKNAYVVYLDVEFDGDVKTNGSLSHFAILILIHYCDIKDFLDTWRFGA